MISNAIAQVEAAWFTEILQNIPLLFRAIADAFATNELLN